MVGDVHGPWTGWTLYDRRFGSILPDIRQNTPKTAITDGSDRGTSGERGPDLRHNPRRPLDQVMPRVPQHRPVGQRNHVLPALITAKTARRPNARPSHPPPSQPATLETRNPTRTRGAVPDDPTGQPG